MNISDLKAGDTLINYQRGYEQAFLIIESDNDLYLESRESRQKIKDYDFKGCHLLITFNDRTEEV